jgi:catechol 2,3-dioxygenase-like lactoylglutathione lyase family enzyme
MRPRLVPELVSADLAQSLSFYCEVLGFRVLYARTEERFAYLELNGAELMLEQPHTQDRLWPKAELAYPFGRGVNFEIHVDDVEWLHTAVCRAKIAFFLPLEEKWYRKDEQEIGVRQFAVQDPDGYLIRLSQALGTRPISR